MVTAAHPPTADRLAKIDEYTFLETVSIAEMFVAPYGRPVSPGQIGRMLKSGFDPRKLGIITLSMRPEGRYAIIDGNHRRNIAVSQGMTHLLARVFIDLTYAEEAKLYEALNTIKPPSAIDRFIAKLEYGDPAAVDIRDRLGQYDLRVSSVSRRDSRGTLQAVGAVERLYSDIGPEAFSVVLGVIHAAWQYDPTAWTGPMFDGMRQFWSRYASVVVIKDLVARLSLVTPAQVLARAGANQLRNESVGVLVGKQLTQVYNARRRSNPLPEWRERVSPPNMSRQTAAVKAGTAVLSRVDLARGVTRE